MLENTTRSATIVFRFCNFNFGEVSLKASYAIRVRCPNRPPHTAAETTTVRFGFIEHSWFLSGVPAPLAGRSLRTDLARFSASANDNFGQTVFVIRFSPVTDAVGRIRRYQRSTCVTAALPAPKRGRENRHARESPLEQLE